MAARTGKKSSPPTAEPTPPVAPPADTSRLDVKALAEAILARTIRPRVTDIRRLAEAILKKKKGKKLGGKKRKLSKIPARKSGK